DRGAIKYDRLLRAGSERLKLGAGLHPDLEQVHSVVKRQVERVLADAWSETRNYRLPNALAGRAVRTGPSPLAPLIPRVQVYATCADRGDSRTGHSFREQRIIHPVLWGIRLEPHEHPGAVPAEVPHVLCHLAFGAGWQAIEPAKSLGVRQG